jgi:hypothetical protein
LQVCCPTYRDLFLLLRYFFSSSGGICAYVIIHGFDGFFSPRGPGEWVFCCSFRWYCCYFFLLGFLLTLFLRFYIH